MSAGLPEWGRGQQPSVLVEGGAVSGGKASEIVDGDAMGVQVACFLTWFGLADPLVSSLI